MYPSFVAVLYSTLALISYSTLTQALPANGEHREYARETGYPAYGMVAPTGTALAASATATITAQGGQSLPLAATLGIIVGGVVFFFILIGGLTWYCRRRNSGKRNTLVLKVDEPTTSQTSQQAITRKATTSTTSSNSGGGGSSHGTLHTINVVSPISTRSPPAVAPADSRRSMNLPSNPRQSLSNNNNAYGRYQPPPGLAQLPVPPVPTIIASGPEDEGRSYISRPITLLPPVPQVLPAGRPQQQMTQANLPGEPRHYMLQSGTVGRQPQQGNDARYARNAPNRRETLRDETVSSAFGLLGPDGNATILSESPQSIGGAPLRLTETTMPSGRR
ncbi:hypothetical protein FRC01_010328 [Tulasnella sp. 417]|nr:hypothetical protein FRC01_010328 [Tulasnella sp. 417]